LEWLKSSRPVARTPIEGESRRVYEPDIEDTAVELQVADCLEKIDPDCDRDTWVKVGMMLHRLSGGDVRGSNAWEAWSRRAAHRYPKGRERTVAQEYRSFNARKTKGVGLGTLIRMANRAGVERTPDKVATVQNPFAPVKAYLFADFLALEFKPGVMLVDPIVVSQSLNMIYGLRGIGKTRFAATVAIAAASGGTAFGWKAARPVKTLYLDGEMAGSDIQGIFRMLSAAAPTGWDPSMLRIVTPDAQDGNGIPDLSTTQGQQLISDIIGDAELIFIDNLSAWLRGTGEENSPESWTPMINWLLRLRSQGRSVVVLHHAGKGGTQRGTSKREDMLDVVLALRRPEDYSAEEGARFEIHFEKGRGLHGETVAPIEVQFSVDRGVPKWAIKSLSRTAEIIALFEGGMSQADIARKLDINKSTVSRAISRHPPVSAGEKKVDKTWKK
jgi:hypothetical protein